MLKQRKHKVVTIVPQTNDERNEITSLSVGSSLAKITKMAKVLARLEPTAIKLSDFISVIICKINRFLKSGSTSKMFTLFFIVSLKRRV